MALVRYVVLALVAGFLWTMPLGAQEGTGTISGVVIDSTTFQPVSGVNVTIVGTARVTGTGSDGAFTLSGVPVGTHTLRAMRIGYSARQQDVTVTAGATVTVRLAMQPQATLIDPVVVTGYGTQRREAVTGSISSIDGAAANVGVVSNVNQMIQGRAAGVTIIQNNGEPGAGAQIRIRGGTSLSASNEPVYVIDGIAVSPTQGTEPSGFGIGGEPPLPRSPLNSLNPSDIASITILKDAAAAIYGTNAANGVILIETKKGTAGRATLEYDGYVAAASPASRLNVLDGAQFDQFVRQEVTAGRLAASHLLALGGENTNWEDAVTRSAVTHNHDFSFSGGTEATRYRASLSYMNQQGVVLANGFERVLGRVNATHQAFDDRLRLRLNMATSYLSNDYLPYELGGGFEGGVFQNVATFNPTQPIRNADGSFYELGTGRQSTRNPVAVAQQVADFGNTSRSFGNVSAELDLVPGLTAQLNVGADRSKGLRQIYLPRSSPVGAEWNGLAQQKNRDNSSVTLQTLLTYGRQFGDIHNLDLVGGYEYTKNSSGEFVAESRNFLSDATGYDNLAGGIQLIPPTSSRVATRQVSFFSRANYGLKDRYFLTGSLRYDGSSVFGEKHRWALFPALSASWRIFSEQDGGNRPLSLSSLRLRGGWGLLGNQAVPAYASLILLEPTGGARYVFGEAAVTGVAPVRNPNPELKWEQASQVNVAVDYGFLNDRVSGSLEYYLKTTSDLLLEVAVPQPALVGSRLENVGKIRNKGLEISIDALALSRPNLTWRVGLVFAAERNRVVDLGPYSFITTGGVSGQGQSGQVSQRILPGHPLGTFYGPVFVGVDAAGKQLFRCTSLGAADTNSTGQQLCQGGQMTTARASDYAVIGNANPDFSLGLRSQLGFGKFNLSFLVNSQIGQDVFNNTALVYSTKGNAKQDKNFLASALNDPTGIDEPAIYSSRWIESASFVRLQNVTLEYQFNLPMFMGSAKSARVYLSGDNLLLLSGYSGLDPEVQAGVRGLAVRGVDYLSYPRPRTFTTGIRFTF